MIILCLLQIFRFSFYIWLIIGLICLIGSLFFLACCILLGSSMTLWLSLKVMVLVEDAIFFYFEVFRMVMVLLVMLRLISGIHRMLSLGRLIFHIGLLIMLISEGSRRWLHLLVLLFMVTMRELCLTIPVFWTSTISFGCLGASWLVTIISIAPLVMVLLLLVSSILPIVTVIACLIVVFMVLSFIWSADVSSCVYILNVIRLGRFVTSNARYCLY